jgi:hypothetical protein
MYSVNDCSSQSKVALYRKAEEGSTYPKSETSYPIKLRFSGHKDFRSMQSYIGVNEKHLQEVALDYTKIRVMDFESVPFAFPVSEQ